MLPNKQAIVITHALSLLLDTDQRHFGASFKPYASKDTEWLIIFALTQKALNKERG